VSLESGSSRPGQASDDCSPGQYLNYNLMRDCDLDPPELRHSCIPDPQKQNEVLNVYCFKLQNLGEIYHAAIELTITIINHSESEFFNRKRKHNESNVAVMSNL